MASTFTVTAVSDNVREYDTDYGPKKAYRVHLRNGDGSEHLNIEWRRNADSPAPSVGQQIEADLVDQGKYGQRLELAQRGGSGGVWSGTKSGGGGSKDFKADPVKQAAIAMENSHGAAIEIAKLALEQGKSSQEIEQVVTQIADRLYERVTAAMKAAQ